MQTELPDLRYNADGLIPCIVQDVETREVLMMAWMNAESLALTLERGETVFWSRSRQELWHKGATSATREGRELRYDCDADTLLALVHPAGPHATTRRPPAVSFARWPSSSSCFRRHPLCWRTASSRTQLRRWRTRGAEINAMKGYGRWSWQCSHGG